MATKTGTADPRASHAPNASAQARGRNFFFAPGPTNIPDRVLGAMNRATVDFLGEDFLALQLRATEGVKRILKTRQSLFFYAANGHGAWEAALANVLRAGEKVLVLESGYFSAGWSDMACALGLDVDVLPSDWRHGVKMDAVAARLAADKDHLIKAVLVTHNETATGVVHPVGEVRGCLDRAKHPALLFADTISSLGSIDFRMDEWGADVVVGGSQKGLMTVTGLSFTGVSDKALQLSERGGLKRSYWDWAAMRTSVPQRFPGTTPVHLFFGLEAGVQVLEEEGIEAVFRRHTRLARATRAAIAAWGGGACSGAKITGAGIAGKVGGVELLCADPDRVSDSVSTILLPDGVDGVAFKKYALKSYNLDLGGGLGPLAGRVFRIGHMGDLNEPMLLGALATVELAFATYGVPHQRGGVTAAIAALQAGAGA